MSQVVVGYRPAVRVGSHWVPYTTVYTPEQERMAVLAITTRYGPVQIRVERPRVRS